MSGMMPASLVFGKPGAGVAILREARDFASVQT